MKKLPHSERRELEVLRQLLVGPELIKLDQLSKRLENREKFSSDVGEILPQALIKSAQQGEQLSQAMVPTVEEIVRLSVKRDLGKFADALFPVIGPAIRKAITESTREMFQSMNQVIENSLSWQGIKWRLQSVRTGVPFSQIVLLNSLIYETEQVFLIHQSTGLLLNHVGREGSDDKNADLVSSMLTAIGDFVSDSFESEQGNQLDTIAVGPISVWIERGPNVVLAIAIRGNAPESLRTRMQQTLEQVESLCSDALINFNGDISAFESIDGVLFECLEAQYQSTRRGFSVKFWLAIILIFGLLLYWAGTSIYRDSLKNDYLTMLNAEPGYAITRVEDVDGILQIYGLRDPLSLSPQDLVANSQLDSELVDHRLQPFQSLEPAIVLKRLSTLLSPPPNVALSVSNDTLKLEGFGSTTWQKSINSQLIKTIGVNQIDNQLSDTVDLASLAIPERVVARIDVDSGALQVSGYATLKWRQTAAQQVKNIPGVLSYDDSQLIDVIDITELNPPESVIVNIGANSLSVSGESTYQWKQQLKATLLKYPLITDVDLSGLQITEQLNLATNIELLKQNKVFFDAATSYSFEANSALELAVEQANVIIKNAKVLGKAPKIIVKGFSDSVGSFDDNVFLSLERADYVSQYLFINGVSSQYVVVEGLKNEVEPELTEEQRRYNRRVEFDVKID